MIVYINDADLQVFDTSVLNSLLSRLIQKMSCRKHYIVNTTVAASSSSNEDACVIYLINANWLFNITKQ